MSVSARDRKSVIYSEVERQRDLLDQQEQRLRAQSEEIEQLRDYAARCQQQLRDDHSAKEQLYSEAQQLREELERLRAQGARPQAPNTSERSARLRAFATKFRCTARWSGDTIELFSRKRQCWVAVPEGTQP